MSVRELGRWVREASLPPPPPAGRAVLDGAPWLWTPFWGVREDLYAGTPPPDLVESAAHPLATLFSSRLGVFPVVPAGVVRVDGQALAVFSLPPSEEVRLCLLSDLAALRWAALQHPCAVWLAPDLSALGVLGVFEGSTLVGAFAPAAIYPEGEE